MKKAPLLFAPLLLQFLLLFSNAFAALSTDTGSCFRQGEKKISGALSFSHFGIYTAADMGFHPLFSVGAAVGYNRYAPMSGWKYWRYPVAGRVAIHPLNFSFLADVLLIRSRIDIYGGLSIGYLYSKSSWNGVTTAVGKPEESKGTIGGFTGIGFQVNERFTLFLESCDEVTSFALGAGWKL